MLSTLTVFAGSWLRLARLGMVCALVAGLSTSALAQDEDDNSTGYEREFNYGVNFNTNGGLLGGIALKYAWERKPGWYNRIYLEVVNIKHMKEVRTPAYISSFIPYKTNYLFAFRPSFGQEWVLFSKAPEEGVQLNLIFGAGPTLGFLKPYYILYNRSNNELNPQSIAYNPDTSLNYVYGHGGILDGLNEMKVVPGFHARTGLAFESGRVRSSVFGIEAGIVAEVYAKPIELLNNGRAPSNGGYTQPQSFAGFYLNLYYGTKH